MRLTLSEIQSIHGQEINAKGAKVETTETPHRCMAGRSFLSSGCQKPAMHRRELSEEEWNRANQMQGGKPRVWWYCEEHYALLPNNADN